MTTIPGARIPFFLSSAFFSAARSPRTVARSARHQGLTLVHLSAQRKCFVWDRGCIEGLFSGVH